MRRRTITLGDLWLAPIVTVGMLGAITLVEVEAQNLSFTGNLTQDNSVQFLDFTVGATSPDVVIRTWSYAGGANASGQTIARGGFDPLLALFNSTGLLINQNDDGTTAQVATDAVTGYHWDSYFDFGTLASGSYTVAIMQYDNWANGPMLTNGFRRDGAMNAWFTRTLSDNQYTTGGFYDVTGNQRDSHWAVDILGVVPRALDVGAAWPWRARPPRPPPPQGIGW